MFEMKKILAGALLVAAASGIAALTTTAAAGAATLPHTGHTAASAAGHHEVQPATREGAVGPDGTRITGFSARQEVQARDTYVGSGASALGDRDLVSPAGNDDPYTREGGVSPDGTRIGGFSAMSVSTTRVAPDGTRIGGF